MIFSFNSEDASQVCVGAFALAVPVAFSEEAWRLGETLPVLNIAMLFSLSLLFLSVFSYHSVFQQNIRARVPVFIFRSVRYIRPGASVARGISSNVIVLLLTSLPEFAAYCDMIPSKKHIWKIIPNIAKFDMKITASVLRIFHFLVCVDEVEFSNLSDFTYP